MNIAGVFLITTDRNMFHEYSYRQRPLLSESPLHAPWPARAGQHRAPFLLSDHARPAPPLPLHLVREDLQLDHGYLWLLKTPSAAKSLTFSGTPA